MKIFFTMMTLTLVFMMVTFYLSKKTFMDKEKSSPFECGFDPYFISRSPFSLRFFKLAIIFLIFDIEIILVLPLPMMINKMNSTYLTSSSLILLIILLGLLYEWKQGSIDWMK